MTHKLTPALGIFFVSSLAWAELAPPATEPVPDSGQDNEAHDQENEGDDPSNVVLDQQEQMTLLLVSSLPSGGAVAVDGVDCGRTPALIEVSPGTHHVRIERYGRVFAATVEAAAGQVTEVSSTFGLTTHSEMLEPSWGQIGRNAPEDQTDGGGSEDEDGGQSSGDVAAQSRISFVPRWPWLEIVAHVGTSTRDFAVPIDPMVDGRRDEASMRTGTTAYFALHSVVFPFVGTSAPLVRGLGLEGGVAGSTDAQMRGEYGDHLDTGHMEVDAGLLWRVHIGRPDVGLILTSRLGWQRLSFFVDETEGNDLIPSFEYDSLRLGLIARVPIATRHVLFELGGTYLRILSVGTNATWAYSQLDSTPQGNGAELLLGIVGQVWKLELGARWLGRWLVAHYIGHGRGTGFDPTTDIAFGGSGILTTGPSVDIYYQMQFFVGYRF